MFGQTYHHSHLRKYVILFGTLFNDIWVNREDASGNVKQSIKVPLSYGPREKFLARVGTPDPLTNEVAITLPMMGFEMTGFTYAAERKLPTINKFKTVTGSDQDRGRFYYNPVPYDINFSLSVFVKNSIDGTKIIEQILPFFTPEWTTTVQLTDNPDITLDVPLVINSISSDDVYEGNFEERRSLIWQVDFTMKAVLFGPVKTNEVIKLANVNLVESVIYDDLNDAVGVAGPDVNMTITPGQDANGNPTTNASLTVDKSEISIGEQYDFIVSTNNVFEQT